MGSLFAGPFCAKILGEFGADVVKIEPPGKGDPLRKWRYLKDGTSVWWHVESRNKRSVGLDLRKPEGQAIARERLRELGYGDDAIDALAASGVVEVAKAQRRPAPRRRSLADAVRPNVRTTACRRVTMALPTSHRVGPGRHPRDARPPTSKTRQ